ncbi:hypothetical protein BCR34DRAFT_564042 [Clohesyomyces aquaticus]|uniref:Cyanovirin-N domain-containing protein n=1 Tax=Clohesyomyces aquaticus TaxID=1231657 RepID=A0A1Y1ZPP7_9PLEO|nr:hypothetical protein BCR34DRAFT_564042 [Clohesyomyces aquaticus]
MHFSTVLLALTTSTVVLASNSCHGQTLYCGKSLDGRGWSISDIWKGIRKGGRDYPDNLSDAMLPRTLFECDGRSGDDALWFRTVCNTCVDAGAGHSDYCAN